MFFCNVPGATMGMAILLMGQDRFWHMPSFLVVVAEVMPISMRMKHGFCWRGTNTTVMCHCLL